MTGASRGVSGDRGRAERSCSVCTVTVARRHKHCVLRRRALRPARVAKQALQPWCTTLVVGKRGNSGKTSTDRSASYNTVLHNKGLLIVGTVSGSSRDHITKGPAGRGAVPSGISMWAPMDQRWSDVCVVAPQDHFRALPAVSLRGGPVQSTIPLPQLQLTAEALSLL